MCFFFFFFFSPEILHAGEVKGLNSSVRLEPHKLSM